MSANQRRDTIDRMTNSIEAVAFFSGQTIEKANLVAASIERKAYESTISLCSSVDLSPSVARNYSSAIALDMIEHLRRNRGESNAQGSSNLAGMLIDDNDLTGVKPSEVAAQRPKSHADAGSKSASSAPKTKKGGKCAPAAQESENKKLRVLCLHGYLQNTEIFRGKTGSLRRALKSLVDFVFVDAPHDALPLPTPEENQQAIGGSEAEGGGRAWWLAGEHADPPPGTSAEERAKQGRGGHDHEHRRAVPRAGTVRPSQSQRCYGVERSLEVLSTVLKEQGPFDGILGFSQGAAIAGMVAGTQRGSRALDSLRFMILVSGFLPRDARWLEAITRDAAPLPIPTLHVLGRADQMVVAEQVHALAALFNEPQLLEHEGRHMVPASADFRNAVKAFIVGFVN